MKKQQGREGGTVTERVERRSRGRLGVQPQTEGCNNFEYGHFSKKIALNIPPLPCVLCCVLFDMIYYESMNLIHQVCTALYVCQTMH